MAKKTEIPAWFNQYSQPYVRDVPSRNFETRKAVNTERVYDSDEILPLTGKRYCIEIETDYDGSPDKIYLVEFTVETTPNESYDAQVKEREDQLKRLNEWHKIKATLKDREEEKRVSDEKELYKKLHKKYGKKK